MSEALITLAEYKSYDSTVDDSKDELIEALIDAATDTIERYTNRTFSQTTYDELYDGTKYRLLLLNHFPVISIDRIATHPLSVITIRNDNAAVSRATVRVTDTGVTLTSVASASTTTTSLSFTTYTTLSALGTAIGAVSGWSAVVTSGYETYSSADLRALQGSLNAKATPAWLVLHTLEINDFRVDSELGEVDYTYGFSRGVQNFRVVYSANFQTIPESIKQVCREITHGAYLTHKLDPNLASESLGIWTWSRTAMQDLSNLSLLSKQALARYRVVRVPRYRNEGLLWGH